MPAPALVFKLLPGRRQGWFAEWDGLRFEVVRYIHRDKVQRDSMVAVYRWRAKVKRHHYHGLLLSTEHAKLLPALRALQLYADRRHNGEKP